MFFNCFADAFLLLKPCPGRALLFSTFDLIGLGRDDSRDFFSMDPKASCEIGALAEIDRASRGIAVHFRIIFFQNL